MSLAAIRDRIARAEAAAGRAPGSVTLVAVSKVQPEERVAAVVAAGQRVFGENRVQEAAGRWPPFRALHADLVLHLIGPLQTNKARQAVEFFDCIQTLDRPRLARRLADLAQERGNCPELFVQVNTGYEPQKAGILPSDCDAFIAECRDMELPVIGLMCIPPVAEDPEAHFALLTDLARRNGVSGLSMGMSEDFERAIHHGATHVRVGSALFGARPG